ncbi:hypothetical protein PISMIDRAFT_120059 [Pisolithus microcarpus 441]|uniref:Uncharacterized protein n=1 Tax=Pisolithus microcarpus 441 TaxID=765257 RepID=A0A0C9YG19_9AGAM|nr:hypothetical protein BKA83DRAFT_4071801 [Pisolithus microcarpus]KIK12894.1 hypothetical protein PISMIDRAFT_120059 [Pisolithus microcarpus 441]
MYVPMHKIPNLALGKVANRSVIRVFFPRLYHRFDSPQIPQLDLELIYNRCLRPIVQRLMPNQATHWPPSYNTILQTSRDQRGRFHFGSFDIPAYLLPRFSELYLQSVQQLRPYFRDAYFAHELRGWKAATVHNLEEDADGGNHHRDNQPYERVNALDDLTGVLHMPSINPDQWLIDVGLEFGNPGHVVTWRRYGHPAIGRHLLPDHNDPAAAMERSRQYYVDYHMHLKDIAGFRWTPGRHSDVIKYVQAYTTEKAISYQLHDGIFRPRKPSELLSDRLTERLLDDLDKQAGILFTCTGNGDMWGGEPQDGCARLEVRVPLNHAQDILTQIPRRLINDTMVQIPSRNWW